MSQERRNNYSSKKKWDDPTGKRSIIQSGRCLHPISFPKPCVHSYVTIDVTLPCYAHFNSLHIIPTLLYYFSLNSLNSAALLALNRWSTRSSQHTRPTKSIHGFRFSSQSPSSLFHFSLFNFHYYQLVS